MRPIGPVATADGYTEAATLEDVPSGVFVRADVYNAAALLELAVGWPPVWTGEELFTAPGFHGWPRRGVAGVRARSAAAGVPATVVLEIRTAAE